MVKQCKELICFAEVLIKCIDDKLSTIAPGIGLKWSVVAFMIVTLNLKLCVDDANSVYRLSDLDFDVCLLVSYLKLQLSLQWDTMSISYAVY